MRIHSSTILPLITSLILLVFAFPVQAETDQEAELKNLRNQIKEVETSIKGAQSEAEKLRKELRENEITTAETLTKLHDVKLNISKKHSELEQLHFEQAEHQSALQQEKEQLKQQIRSAYRMGRNDYLKLILNQENPALVGRVLAYYDYHNRARTERIDSVQRTLMQLANIEMTIQDQTNRLEGLKADHENKLSDFHQYRATRYDIITRLQKYIDDKGVELHTLQENEKELGKLFQGLKKEKTSTVEMYEDIPPFNTLKGRLSWPAKGKLIKRFGHLKKGGNLKWQGVLIDAETGTSVNAVGAGKVVFADWFRNLGLLIIIDHGDGYMSLYGHNQNLLKNTGDWVLSGDKIATVGDSGGQSDTALYFEIRKGAEPLNPSKWVKR